MHERYYIIFNALSYQAQSIIVSFEVQSITVIKRIEYVTDCILSISQAIGAEKSMMLALSTCIIVSLSVSVSLGASSN